MGYVFLFPTIFLFQKFHLEQECEILTNNVLYFRKRTL